jgi:hypothetical protein
MSAAGEAYGEPRPAACGARLRKAANAIDRRPQRFTEAAT